MADSSITPVASQVCSRCDAPVSGEDLAQGLAIHLDGVPVCSMCIELLPVDTRLQINQVRASKGLAVTVYRLPHPKHPKFTLYTFSSAALLTVHRRALVKTGRYEVRWLSQKSLLTSVDRLLLGRSKLLFVGGVALAGVVMFTLVWSTLGTGRKDSPTRDPTPVAPGASVAAPSTPIASTSTSEQAPPATATLTRKGLPEDPYEAWASLAMQTAPPAALIRSVANEVTLRREGELSSIARALAQTGPEAALRQLEQHRLQPNDPAFAEVQSQEARLRSLIQERLAAAVPTPEIIKPGAPLPSPSVAIATAAQVLSPAAIAPAIPASAKSDSVPSASPVTPAPVTPAPVTAVAPEAKIVVPSVVPPSIRFLDWAASERGSTVKIASLTDPADPQIPSPWPLVVGWDGSQQFVASEYEKTNGVVPGWKGRQALHFHLDPDQVAKGGVVLSLHGGSRASRRELAVVVDPGGRVLSPQIIKGAWQEVVISLPEDLAGPIVLHLADQDPLKASAYGSFWGGPGVAVAHRPPTAADLGLAPSPLPWDLIGAQSKIREGLVRQIQNACMSRGVNSWQRFESFNPWAIKVLCADITDSWKTQMRKELPRSDDSSGPANLTVAKYTADPAWWSENQLTGSHLTVDAKHYQVVVFIPNGTESDRSPQVWASQVRDLANQVLTGGAKSTRKAGFLPVMVLGCVDDPEVMPANWALARAELERLSLPLIDLSILPRHGLTKTAWQAESAQAIGHSLANLAYQLRWRQGKK